MVTENDLALGGGHTVQHTDPVSQKCALGTYAALLSSLAPIHLIKKRLTLTYLKKLL